MGNLLNHARYNERESNLLRFSSLSGARFGLGPGHPGPFSFVPSSKVEQPSAFEISAFRAQLTRLRLALASSVASNWLGPPCSLELDSRILCAARLAPR